MPSIMPTHFVAGLKCRPAALREKKRGPKGYGLVPSETVQEACSNAEPSSVGARCDYSRDHLSRQRSPASANEPPLGSYSPLRRVGLGDSNVLRGGEPFISSCQTRLTAATRHRLQPIMTNEECKNTTNTRERKGREKKGHAVSVHSSQM